MAGTTPCSLSRAACGQYGDNYLIEAIFAAQVGRARCGQNWVCDTPERSNVRRVALADEVSTRRVHRSVRRRRGNLPITRCLPGATRPTFRACRTQRRGAGTGIRRPGTRPSHSGDDRRQPATTATSTSVVTSGWRRTVTGCLPTVLIWLGTSTARRSSAGPPAARTASTTSAAVTEPNSRPESPAAFALTVTARLPSCAATSRACPRSRISRDLRARGSRRPASPRRGWPRRPARAEAGSCGRSRP